MILLHDHTLTCIPRCIPRCRWEYSRLMSTSTRGAHNNILGSCVTTKTTDTSTPGWCELDAGQAVQRWPFTKSQEDRSERESTLFTQGILKQEAHTCDRDYMYVRGMMSCHGYPSQTWWRPMNGTNLQVVYPNFLNQASTYLKQMNLFRTYRSPSSSASTSNSTSDSIRIGVMRHMNDTRFGFLGKRATAPNRPYDTYPSWQFTKCSSIRTCSIQNFTVYGYRVEERRIRRVGAGDPIEGIKRSSLDTYRCGPYGYLTSETVCAMDLSVVPLYRTMCYSQSSRNAIRDGCPNTLVSGGTEAGFVSDWCSKFISTIGGATCDGKPYTFLPPQTGNPTVFPLDGYIPTWTANVESLREGIPCLLNRLARDVVQPLKPYRFPADAGLKKHIQKHIHSCDSH